MRLLEQMRRERGLSQLELGCKCKPSVAPSYLSNAERHGFIYPSQLKRIAKALRYEGDPSELLEEVEL